MQIMMDLETLGSGYRAQIIQIGLVSFDFGFQPQEAIEILNNPDRWLNVAVDDYGGTRDNSNMDWWALPEQAQARKLIGDMERKPLRVALAQITSFVQSYLGNRAMLWAKPPGFDVRVLREAYEIAGMEVPWHWKQEACLRTLTWVADRVPRNKFRLPDISSQGLVPHYSLHDSVEQTILAQGAYRALVEHGKAA